jgi:hypothetical protein
MSDGEKGRLDDDELDELAHRESSGWLARFLARSR